MNKIEVKILYHNFNHMPIFLARLTQRGAEIKDMNDLIQIYDATVGKMPSVNLMELPHTTIRRMCYLTVAIVGLSTKAVSQLRTHATRLTFLSTSTQYSSFEERPDNFVIPEQNDIISEAYLKIEEYYKMLLQTGVDKDVASYVMPQGLRKALVISGNLADWEYMLSIRLCNRNTKEVQHICEMIVGEIIDKCGQEYVVNMMPSCVYDKCHEGKFSCGHCYHHLWRFKNNSKIREYEV